MLAALKASIKNRAYYWPTTDRLAFQFAEGTELEDENEGIDPELLVEAGEPAHHETVKKLGFSSGERQLKSLQEIVRFTDASISLLEEWDAERVPVVDGGRLVGVLSRSVLQRRLAEDEPPAELEAQQQV